MKLLQFCSKNVFQHVKKTRKWKHSGEKVQTFRPGFETTGSVDAEFIYLWKSAAETAALSLVSCSASQIVPAELRNHMHLVSGPDYLHLCWRKKKKTWRRRSLRLKLFLGHLQTLIIQIKILLLGMRIFLTFVSGHSGERRWRNRLFSFSLRDLLSGHDLHLFLLCVEQTVRPLLSLRVISISPTSSQAAHCRIRS